MALKKLDFLPTKIKYNSNNRSIDMYYRLKRSNKLYHANIPFDHYIYTSTEYRRHGVIEDKYKLLGTDEELAKVYLSPYDAFKLYNDNITLTYGEADISAEQRFVCDTFYNTIFPSNIYPRIYYLDIETHVTDGLLPSFNNNMSDINAITIYDNYTEKYYSWFLLTKKDFKRQKSIKNKLLDVTEEYGLCEIYLFENPKQLLMSFIQFINNNCPDIVTAWNSKFDIPYICRKIYDYLYLDGLKLLSPYNYVSKKITKALEYDNELSHDNLIPGIDVIDLLTLYKKYGSTEKASYALKNVAEEELGESKLYISEESEYNDLTELYNNDIINFCKYNIQDTRLLVLLENKLKILNLAVTIRNISKINYREVFSELKIIDNILVSEIVRRREEEGSKYVLPSTARDIKKEKYLGAFVKKTLAGRYKWISDLDYKSMYPSIILSFTLSPETVVATVDNYQKIVLYTLADIFKINDLDYIKEELLPKYLVYDFEMIKNISNDRYVDLDKINSLDLDISLEYYPLYNNKYNISFKNLRAFKKWLKENNFVFLPSGLVVDQNKNNSILPEIVNDVMESRVKYKNLMKVNLERGNKDLYEMYQVYQDAIKLINNSIYGATASKYFRLYDVNISSGITTSGQLLIRSTTYLTNKYLNNLAGTVDNDYVITNDTDSIIFTLQDIFDYAHNDNSTENLQEIFDASVKCQDYINEEIFNISKNIFYKYKTNKSNNYLRLESEWLANTGIFLAKKSYAINIVLIDGIPEKKLKPMGMALKKSSTPKQFKLFLEKILINILDFKEKDIIDKIVIDECNKLKDDYSLENIALPISINNIKAYKNLPIHVRGANVWNEYFAKRELDKIIFGKIKYIYVKKWKNNELNMKKEYVISVPDNNYSWDNIKDEIEVDYDKMKDRLILKPVDTFYKVLGWQLPFEATSKNKAIFKKIKSNSNNKIKLI